MCISQYKTITTYKTKPYTVSFEIYNQNIYLKILNIEI